MDPFMNSIIIEASPQQATGNLPGKDFRLFLFRSLTPQLAARLASALFVQTGNFITVFLILMVILCANGVHADTTVIKIALITPKGSAWTNMLYKMAKEVEIKTDNEVDFKIYPGGISGDELDVVRKMRVNRIHAAGFSGVGLGVLLPQIRILEAPLLYHNYAEIDLVKEKLFNDFSANMERNGYVLLGFAEAGFVYIFSRTDISDPNWLYQTKMWVWKGDPVAGTFFNTVGIKTYPLHLMDVNTGLETGMIDSFYSPPLGAIAFQWHSKIRYMLDYPMVNSTGALVMKKDVFDGLSLKNQEILKSVAREYCDKLIQLSRKDNLEAITVMKEAGIKVIPPSNEQILSFKENAKRSYLKNIPELYTRDLLNQVQNILKEYRQTLPPA